MRRIVLLVTLLTVVALLVGAALAQAAPPTASGVPGFDLDAWAVSAGALALGVFTIVAFIKTHVFKFAGRVTILVSFGVSIAISVALFLSGHMEGDLIGAIMHGLTAAIVASGWHDGTSSTVETGVTEAPAIVMKGAEPAPGERMVP